MNTVADLRPAPRKGAAVGLKGARVFSTRRSPRRGSRVRRHGLARGGCIAAGRWALARSIRGVVLRPFARQGLLSFVQEVDRRRWTGLCGQGRRPGDQLPHVRRHARGLGDVRSAVALNGSKLSIQLDPLRDSFLLSELACRAAVARVAMLRQPTEPRLKGPAPPPRSRTCTTGQAFCTPCTQCYSFLVILSETL